jgi:hypothetical protein
MQLILGQARTRVPQRARPRYALNSSPRPAAHLEKTLEMRSQGTDKKREASENCSHEQAARRSRAPQPCAAALGRAFKIVTQASTCCKLCPTAHRTREQSQRAGATVNGPGHVRGARVGSAAGAKAEADATRPARARTRAYMVLRGEGTSVARILAFSDSVGRIASKENVTGNTGQRHKNATMMLREVLYRYLHKIS